IVHRDLKPENVILEEGTGRPRILDLGIARVDPAWLATGVASTRAGELLGTVRYMSPEQARGQVDGLDRRSDVYALALLTYEMLTGSIPYDVHDETLHELLGAILLADPVPMRSRRPELPGALDAAILPALAKAPWRRPESAARLGESLAAIRRGDRVTSARLVWRWRAHRGARRLTRAWILIGAVVTILVVLLSRGPIEERRTLTRAWGRLDAALDLVHAGERTDERLRVAIDSLQAARADIQELHALPWRAPLQRYVAHRLGEATFLLGARVESASELRRAFTFFQESAETPCDSTQFTAIPVDHPLRALILDLGPFSAWAGEGMVLEALASFDLPVRNLSLSVQARESGLQAIEGEPSALRRWQAPVFASSVSARRREQHRAYLLNDLAWSMSELAVVVDSLSRLDDALTMFDQVERIEALRTDRPAYASYLHHRGVTLRRRGERDGSAAVLVEADDALARALQTRTLPYGSEAHAATRIERVRVQLARARLSEASFPSAAAEAAARELNDVWELLRQEGHVLPRIELATALAEVAILAGRYGNDTPAVAADSILTETIEVASGLEEGARPRAELHLARARVRTAAGRVAEANEDLAVARDAIAAGQYPALEREIERAVVAASRSR
ncbi:MAG: protein kinase, partial [Gemmatimonadetes bacterium]|nr:protein kinase [Gemmatimonadota bacterium]